MAIKLVKHPLISHKMTHIRKTTTNSTEFRQYLEEITKLMAYDVLANLTLKKINIKTPIAPTTGFEVNQEINLFPVLRAGIGMVSGFQTLTPNARVGHIGIYRDHKTLKPVKYLFKAPKDTEKDSLNIILDPMIATGGSIRMALDILIDAGYKNIKLVCLVAAKPTIEKIAKEYPSVDIYVAAIDSKLNKDGYIVPGLGDAGDRIFGTK